MILVHIYESRLMHGTCWFRLLVHVFWCRLIGTNCYRLLVHVDSDRLSTFGIYILGWLDRARIGSGIHLPVLAEELRAL